MTDDEEVSATVELVAKLAAIPGMQWPVLRDDVARETLLRSEAYRRWLDALPFCVAPLSGDIW